ncbi:MAG: hypothetical protein ACKO5E_04145 [bacterium]
MLLEIIVSFIIILAGVWFLAELLQGAWYESVVPNLAARVLLAAILLTALQIFSHIRMETLLSDNLPMLIASGILWVAAFWAILQFAASHALGLGVAGMLVLTCLAGLASDGIAGLGSASPRIDTAKPAKKAMRIRTSNSPTAVSQLNVYPERARKAASPADGSTPTPAQSFNAAPAQTPADATKPQVSGDNKSQALNPEVNKTAPGQPTDTTKKSP